LIDKDITLHLKEGQLTAFQQTQKTTSVINKRLYQDKNILFVKSLAQYIPIINQASKSYN